MEFEQEMKTGSVGRQAGGEMGEGPGCPWAGTSPQLIPGEAMPPFSKPHHPQNLLPPASDSKFSAHDVYFYLLLKALRNS